MAQKVLTLVHSTIFGSQYVLREVPDYYVHNQHPSNKKRPQNPVVHAAYLTTNTNHK